MNYHVDRIAMTLLLALGICNVANAFQYDQIYKQLTGNTDYNSRVETVKKGEVTKAVITDRDISLVISLQKDGTYKYEMGYLNNPDLVEKGTYDRALRQTSSALYYKGKPSLNSAGYSSRTISYKAGRVTEYLYGTDGKRTCGRDGYSIKVLQRPILHYDSEYLTDNEESIPLAYSQVYRVSYYDTDSIPVELSGVHSKEVNIDNNGIRVSYRDAMGKRTANDFGYSDITCRPNWSSTWADSVGTVSRMDVLKQMCVPTTYLMLAREYLTNYLLESNDSDFAADAEMLIDILSRPLEIRNCVNNPTPVKNATTLKQLRSMFRMPEASAKLQEYLSIVSVDDLYEYMKDWDVIIYSPNREPMNIQGVACVTLIPDHNLGKYVLSDMFDADGNRVQPFR